MKKKPLGAVSNKNCGLSPVANRHIQNVRDESGEALVYDWPREADRQKKRGQRPRGSFQLQCGSPTPRPQFHDCLGTGMNVELLIDVVEMCPYGVVTDVQFLCDLMVPKTGPSQTQDFFLPFC